MSIRILTDSTADLSPELAAEHNIAVVPASVLFGDEELLDGVDIQSAEFYARLASDPVLRRGRQHGGLGSRSVP